MEEFVKKMSEMKVLSGISSTNTYGVQVVDQNGGEFFPGRPTAGLSGAAILNLSMEQARKLVELRENLGMKDEDFVIIGIGGVTEVSDVEQYLNLGVDAVQSAVGMYENPALARDWFEYSKKQ